MPYEYLEDIATADVAFRAWAKTPEELFEEAAKATMNVMVENPEAVQEKETRRVDLEEDTLDGLLHQFLEEFIFYKDAEQLLLKPFKVQIEEVNGRYRVSGELRGEFIDLHRHHFNVDAKAVTHYRFAVKETPSGLEATVVLDI